MLGPINRDISPLLAIRRSAIEWSELFRIEIIDPDGWRNEGISFESPINLDTFLRLLEPSTRSFPKPCMDLTVDKAIKIVHSMNEDSHSIALISKVVQRSETWVEKVIKKVKV